MALTSWDVFSKLRQGKQVINHLWVAKDTASNDLYVLEVDAASGGFPITFAADKNWGVVGANTLRTAAIVGNQLGLADFNAGVTGAQTLRTAANIYGSGGQVLDMNAGAAAATTLRVVLATGGAGISFSADQNWGVVGANTLRTAAEVGNEVGLADFNLGATGAQTLRTSSNLALAGTAIPAGFGTITTGLRAAAQIGNATGAADFGAGVQGAQTLRTIIASDQTAIPVTVSNIPGTVPLDFGVTTNAQRTAAQIGNATGAADFNAGTTGAQTLRVVLPTDQTAIPVSNFPATVAVNDGASNANTLRVSANLNYGGTPATVDFGVSTNALRAAALLGNATGLVAYGTGADSAQTLRTTLSTRAEASATPLATRAGNGTNFADFAAGATGAATPRVSANIMRDGNALDYNAGASSANTLRVVNATGGAPATLQSGAYVTSTRTDFSSVTLSLSTWTQLVASTSAIINNLTIFMSSGVTLELATGAAASETRVLLVPPGGFDAVVPLFIAAGTRISVRAVDAVPTTGFLTINYIA